MRHPPGPRGAAAAASAADHLRVPGTVPAAAAAGPPRLGGGDDDPVLLQPEDPDSTRVYTCLLLSAGSGQPLPSPDVVAAEVALEQRVLTEDLELQAQMASTGLPLGMRDELHVRADRLGVALRRALADFAATR